MGATFTRINSVIVDPNTSQIRDAYLDPSVATGGTYAANLAQELQTTASYGQLYRGMPVLYNLSTMKLVPPNASSGTSSTTGSTTTFAGIVTKDVTAWLAAKGIKISIVQKGRVRTYAAGTITPGAFVKFDISSNFSGVLAWNSVTDDPALKIGRAFPIDDGSNTGTAVTSIAQGDTVFLDM